MQRYPVRATHRANLTPEVIERLLGDCFGAARRDGEWATATFGAIERIRAQGDRKELAVEVTMNAKVPNDVAADTIARYNRFLEAATGYSSKERAKRLRKSAGEAPAGA